MKIRQGFVSNSSSSSFIVGPNDLDTMKSHYIKCYKISDLIIQIDEIRQHLNDMPYFIWQDWDWLIQSQYQRLVELEKERPGYFITEAYDRDLAYESNFDYATFETDL